MFLNSRMSLSPFQKIVGKLIRAPSGSKYATRGPFANYPTIKQFYPAPHAYTVIVAKLSSDDALQIQVL
jgi:hypothetical protein